MLSILDVSDRSCFSSPCLFLNDISFLIISKNHPVILCPIRSIINIFYISPCTVIDPFRTGFQLSTRSIGIALCFISIVIVGIQCLPYQFSIRIIAIGPNHLIHFVVLVNKIAVQCAMKVILFPFHSASRIIAVNNRIKCSIV